MIKFMFRTVSGPVKWLSDKIKWYCFCQFEQIALLCLNSQIALLCLNCYISTLPIWAQRSRTFWSIQPNRGSSPSTYNHMSLCSIDCSNSAYLVVEALLNSHFSIWWGWGLLSLRIKELNDIHGMLDNSQRGSKAWIENGRNVSSHRQCFNLGQHSKYKKESFKCFNLRCTLWFQSNANRNVLGRKWGKCVKF